MAVQRYSYRDQAERDAILANAKAQGQRLIEDRILADGKELLMSVDTSALIAKLKDRTATLSEIMDLLVLELGL